MSVAGLSLELPPDVVEAIAQRTAEIVLERQAEQGRSDGPRWLYGAKAAADYLDWPLGRVEKATAADAIPCHRSVRGGRVSYRTDELDDWLEGQREGPAANVRRLGVA